MEKPAAILIIAIFIAAVGGIVWLNLNQSLNPGGICSPATKTCPDGSQVIRRGDCGFPACPAGSLPNTPPENSLETGSWETRTDAATGITFKYPEKLDTEYIRAVDWPPLTQITNETYSCAPGGSEIDRAGITEEKNINGRQYCVTKRSEGAAGSIYVLYAYGLPRGKATLFFTFSLRYPQCANYPDPQKTACEAENSAFNTDSLIDAIAQSAS